MDLTPEQEDRIRENIKNDPLAQMHLLLREHGWRPSYYRDWQFWKWTHREFAMTIITTRALNSEPRWDVVQRDSRSRAFPWPGGYPKQGTSVASLRRHLKQLAKKSPASPHPSRRSKPTADR
jgi:hypothetical protein